MVTMLPRIKIRLNFQIVERTVPTGLTIKLPARPFASSADDCDEDENDDGEGGEEGEEEEDSEEQWEEGDLRDKVEEFMDNEEEMEEEDGPDYMFERGELKSRRPDYVFCPACHRRQLLLIFTDHYCQHPLFPEPEQVSGAALPSATEIRRRCVHEMYTFCKERGLREVWAYMRTSWSSTKMWPLWARSFSPYISRLPTTMRSETCWKEVKHGDLHHLLHPRLDQLVYVICADVLPTYMQRAFALEEMFRASRSKPLNNWQVRFKRAWKKLANLEVSGRVHTVNVARWTCNCGRQKFDGFGLCKHLIRAVPKPPAIFFLQVYRRRTLPLYRHPALHAIGEPAPSYEDIDGGCITDGDDSRVDGRFNCARG